MRKNFSRSGDRNATQSFGCLILGLVLLTCRVSAGQFSYSDHISAAYQSTIALNFQDADFFLEKERLEQPDNPLIIWLESYQDFLYIFLSEEQDKLEAFDNKKGERIDAIEAGDQNSPWLRYCKADMLLHSALARIKFEEYKLAAWEIRKAFKVLEENQRKFPDFGPNLKGLGLLHALIGTIPDSYQWVVRLLGLSGEVDQGINELRAFLDYSREHEYMLYDEGILMYAFLLVYVGNDRLKATEITDGLATDESLMNVFVVADVAMRCGRNDKAIEVLSQRPSGESYFDFVFLDFLLGAAKLSRLDEDSGQYLERFINEFKGLHYVKQACQRLAWSRLIVDDSEGYQQIMKQTKQLGTTLMDADKQALQEANSGIAPNASLLKAELLFNGGYYAKANEVLESVDLVQLKTDKDQLEFTYRRARVLEGLAREEEAALLYEETIEHGLDQSYYFAAKASLQLALMYERKGKSQLAKQYFETCLEAENHSYKDSIDQQAKAGLNRLKNRQ